MSKNKIMPWVDALPNVEATDFQARRDQIEATMAEAAELVKQAEGPCQLNAVLAK